MSRLAADACPMIDGGRLDGTVVNVGYVNEGQSLSSVSKTSDKVHFMIAS